MEKLECPRCHLFTLAAASLEDHGYCDNCNSLNPISKLPPRTLGAHYKRGKIDLIEFALDNDIPFAEATIMKYTYRWKDKGGVEDLHKALDYLQRLIAHAEKQGESK